MADERTEHPANDEVEIGARLSALLVEPVVWAEPDPGAVAAIVAAITAAAAAQRTGSGRELDVVVTESTDNVMPISAAPSSGVIVLSGSAD